MTFLENISDKIKYETLDNSVKFEFEGNFTNWMDEKDSFIKRIENSKLNKVFLKEHILKEFEIKNILDEGIGFLNSKKYANAIECFDNVLYYDKEYSVALINKSKALFGQKHFVKSLRYYKRAVRVDTDLKDIEYHKLLLNCSNHERDSFSKLKLNIYAGDEYFAKGDYENALKNYDNALVNPSQFKEKILFKLFNKKATTCVKLNDFKSALYCFNESLNSEINDYAYYGCGVCQYELKLDGVAERLSHANNIKKELLLDKGLILNEIGLYEEALATFNKIFDNHFKVDELYIKALNGKMYAMRCLKMDLTTIEEICSILVVD